ncbi:YTH domain family protein 3 [Cricetulus griseus]|uniref:YTH domain family protein 3 n=1 Tax=Cricetulus griseus TaxID=10029 RepID=A0A061IIQ9_CRIGR|nr:YTH domain family protein 3 [Cricetulus griseus]
MAELLCEKKASMFPIKNNCKLVEEMAMQELEVRNYVRVEGTAVQDTKPRGPEQRITWLLRPMFYLDLTLLHRAEETGEESFSVQNGSIHQKDAVNDDDFEPYLSSQTNQIGLFVL